MDDRKVKDYLLHPDDEQSRGKSALFQQYGFARAKWEILATALRNHATSNPVVQIASSTHGLKYVVRCNFETPDGRDPCLTSVWIIETGLDHPRLVTAY